MNAGSDAVDFHAFEHAGWEAVPDQYDGYFANLTSQSIEPLLDATDVRDGSRVLDVMTGPLKAQSAQAMNAIRQEVCEAPRPYVVGDGIELPMPSVLASAAKGPTPSLIVGDDG